MFVDSHHWNETFFPSFSHFLSFISARCFIPYRKQSFDLQGKSNERFLYEMQDWA